MYCIHCRQTNITETWVLKLKGLSLHHQYLHISATNKKTKSDVRKLNLNPLDKQIESFIILIEEYLRMLQKTKQRQQFDRK